MALDSMMLSDDQLALLQDYIVQSISGLADLVKRADARR
jgi:hypothetical protein